MFDRRQKSSACSQLDEQGPECMNKIRLTPAHDTTLRYMVPDAGPETSVGGERLSPTEFEGFPAASSLDEPHEPSCVIALR